MLFKDGVPAIKTCMRDSKCITDVFNSPASTPEIQCAFLHIRTDSSVHHAKMAVECKRALLKVTTSVVQSISLFGHTCHGATLLKKFSLHSGRAVNEWISS